MLDRKKMEAKKAADAAKATKKTKAAKKSKKTLLKEMNAAIDKDQAKLKKEMKKEKAAKVEIPEELKDNSSEAKKTFIVAGLKPMRRALLKLWKVRGSDDSKKVEAVATQAFDVVKDAFALCGIEVTDTSTSRKGK